MTGIAIKDIDGALVELKDKMELAHDCCLYARSYFETRQKSNNPDNELGKILKAIKLLDESWHKITQQGEVRIRINPDKLAAIIYYDLRGSRREPWEKMKGTEAAAYCELLAKAICSKEVEIIEVCK